MSTGEKVAAAFVVAVLVVGLTIGGWFAYWALAGKSVSNRYDINTNTQQYQAGLISQERDRAQAYDLAADDAQKTNIRSTFCAVYADMTKPPADLINAHTRICR